MHGIKDPDVKEMTELTSMEEREVKEDTKVITQKINSVTELNFCGYTFSIFKQMQVS